MEVSPVLPGGPATQAPPPPVADLRPAADAAALAGDPRPAAAAMSALPQPLPLPLTAPLSQTAEVSRSLVAASGPGGPEPVAEPARVLKPWGVAMLPAAPEDRSDRMSGDGRDPPRRRAEGGTCPDRPDFPP